MMCGRRLPTAERERDRGAIVLRARYAMSGTEVAYAATRWRSPVRGAGACRDRRLPGRDLAAYQDVT
eukprot:1552327-Rhodomonas_salina.1